MKSSYNYINPDGMRKILDEIHSLGIRKWSVTDIQMLFKTMYWCALRFDEGIKLKYEDIDIENQVVFLGKTKNKKTEKAIIPDRFTNELTEWLAEKTPGRLFAGLSYNTAIRWVYRLGEKLQIEAWITPQKITGEKTLTHIFRKSVAKDMIYGTHTKEKAPINMVVKNLRHGDTKITYDYIKVGDEDLKDFWDE